MAATAPWSNSFAIDGVWGAPIVVEQCDRKTFRLDSSVEYVGEETGLEHLVDSAVVERIRRITPDELPETDLVSVPGPFRWFVGRYGSHTPAALIHDRFIGAPDPIPSLSDQYVDRYFRFVLAATGVRWLRRWIMWAAVAMRTRFGAGGMRRWTVLAWATLAVLGTTALVIALLDGNWGLAALAVGAPLPASALWGRQYGAGLVVAYSAPWIVPPSALAAVAYLAYLLTRSPPVRSAPTSHSSRCWGPVGPPTSPEQSWRRIG
jgi:hypothetical protein